MRDLKNGKQMLAVLIMLIYYLNLVTHTQVQAGCTREHCSRCYQKNFASIKKYLHQIKLLYDS